MLNTLYSTMRKFWPISFLEENGDKLFQRWLSKRLPASKEMTLNQSNIFILPTFSGLAYLLFVLIVFIVAVNFENAIVYGFCFLLASIFITTLIRTFINLSGLTCKTCATYTCFANERSRIDLHLSSSKQAEHVNILVEWLKQQRMASLVMGENHYIPQHDLMFEFTAHQRGWLPPQRLRISTTYPLGLVRAWSWIQPEWRVLVYPEPVSSSLPSNHQSTLEPAIDPDDFKGLRAFQAGDSLHHVAWKIFARGRGLHVKVFDHEAAQEHWICWDDIHESIVDIETRLSILCAWVLDAQSKDGVYGLKLPQVTIEPDLGPQHQAQCLKALALYKKG